MLLRSLRPLASQATRLAITPRIYPNPCALRTVTNTVDATTANPPNLTIETPSPTSAPPLSQPQIDEASRSQLPYFVGRNNLNNLSIYVKNKRGGNLKLTVLKNIEGDRRALKEDLKEALNLTDQQITINSVTNHIVIKGHMRDEVKNFVHNMGF
ncbi:mitochondrial large subunit ribosomal protein-domain-containing protein [Nemania sp. FL0916]|nr:mitochondrial large subunit ribosomal protein-domain-containing protein [Nemania sp. FL0916]